MNCVNETTIKEYCAKCNHLLTGVNFRLPRCCHRFCEPCLKTQLSTDLEWQCPIDQRRFSQVMMYEGNERRGIKNIDDLIKHYEQRKVDHIKHFTYNKMKQLEIPKAMEEITQIKAAIQSYNDSYNLTLKSFENYFQGIITQNQLRAEIRTFADLKTKVVRLEEYVTKSEENVTRLKSAAREIYKLENENVQDQLFDVHKILSTRLEIWDQVNFIWELFQEQWLLLFKLIISCLWKPKRSFVKALKVKVNFENQSMKRFINKVEAVAELCSNAEKTKNVSD